MKDKELKFDRTCHVLYTKPCKKEILSKIALHYREEERETVWDRVQMQYVDFFQTGEPILAGRRIFTMEKAAIMTALR